MKIELHPDFKKSYKKRISNKPRLASKTKERIKLFQDDPNDPVLRSHQLKGAKKNLKAFSVTGNIRIVYLRISENHVVLLDIGSHNQVY